MEKWEDAAPIIREYEEITETTKEPYMYHSPRNYYL